MKRIKSSTMAAIKALRRIILVIIVVSWSFAPGLAQTTASTQQSNKSKAPSRVAGSVASERTPVVPQVVTVVHRLKGLKMFRLLLHSGDRVQAIAGLDDAFRLMDDVHTNVIAGLALDDGQTVVAWLPEAEIESGVPSSPLPAPRAPLSQGALLASPLGSTTPKVPLGAMNENLSGPPDVTRTETG